MGPSFRNYRPFSLTSQICKICEKLVQQRIMVDFIEGITIIYCAMSNTVSGNPCLDRSVWWKLFLWSFIFRFSKDFRNSNSCHGRLICKWQKYSPSIVSILTILMKPFHMERKLHICVNGAKSTWRLRELRQFFVSNRILYLWNSLLIY